MNENLALLGLSNGECMEHVALGIWHYAWMRALTSSLATLIVAAGLLVPGTSAAAMHATQAEAYQACMVTAKLNYEARILPFYAQKYRCTRSPNPSSSNAYTGEIWLKSCQNCPYIWSYGYGREEWPLLSMSPPRNMGPSCEEPRRCGTDGGNPINFGAGNKYEVATDVEARALLGFVRTYNSLPVDNAVRPLGPGWTHSYLARVEASTLSSAPGRWAKVHRATGGYSFFVYQSDGQWLPDAGADDRLTEFLGPNNETIGWEYEPGSRSTSERFDAKGRLSRITNRDGDLVDLEYNNGIESGTPRDFLATRVVARSGRALTLAYDNEGHLATIAAPDGGQYVYAHDATGQLSRVTYPDNTTRQYIYNEATFTASTNLPTALTGIVDETGNRFATFRYDSAGRAYQTEHAGGVDRYSAAYNPTSNLVPIMDPLGRVQRRDLTSIWSVRTLGSQSDQCAGCTSAYEAYTYDNGGKLDTVKDRRGMVVNHDLNAWGAEVQRVDAVGTVDKRTTQTDYDSDLRVPVERRLYNAAGALLLRTTWTRNARGQELSMSTTDPSTGEVRTTSRAYCEQAQVDAGICPLVGLLLSSDGPRLDVNDVTTYDYYMSDHPGCATAPTSCSWHKGDLWRVTGATGQVIESLRYDGAGRLLSTKDANGVVTDFEYDARGRLLARKTRGAQ